MEYNEWYIMGSEFVLITQIEGQFGRVGWVWNDQDKTTWFNYGFRSVEDINKFEDHKSSKKTWKSFIQYHKIQMIKDLYEKATKESKKY